MAKVSVKAGGKIQVLTGLTGGRNLGVEILIGHEAAHKLTFEIWGRAADQRMYYLWPGDELGPDFLTPYESIILRGGLEEVANGCLGKMVDHEFVATVIEAVEYVLNATAVGSVIKPATV